MRIFLIAAAALAVPGAAFAQAPSGNAQVVQEIDACRSIADPVQRLACFDRTAAALATATRNREVVVLDEQEVKKTERSLFGFSLPRIPFFGGDEKGKDGKPEPVRARIDSIESRITAIVPAGYSKWAFVLADGSRWQMIEMNTALRPRVGDTIVIQRAALGSFRASVGGSKLVRIRRTG